MCSTSTRTGLTDHSINAHPRVAVRHVLTQSSGRYVAPIRRLVDDETEDGEVGFVASRVTGRLRLVAGMVRANRPGRALLGLSKLLVGAFGTAAFSLATNSIWQMGDALDGLRLTGIMLLSVAALVSWLVFTHHLWEKPSPDTPAELARLFNLGTVITLSLAAAVSYAVLFMGTLGAAALLIDATVLEQNIGHPVGLRDYLTLAWIISSMATVGGAIGSGLEDEEDVRAAAYGYHPTPGGWSEEQDEEPGSRVRGQRCPPLPPLAPMICPPPRRACRRVRSSPRLLSRGEGLHGAARTLRRRRMRPTGRGQVGCCQDQRALPRSSVSCRRALGVSPCSASSAACSAVNTSTPKAR